MYNSQRGNDRGSGSGGWKGGNKFGDKKPWDRGSGGRGDDRSSMHPAVCSACKRACEVPFRPNGKKPVFCTDCFKKDNDSQSRSFGAPSSSQSQFRERRESFMDNRQPQAQKEGDQNTAQLIALNNKLDKIIQLLSAQRTQQTEQTVTDKVATKKTTDGVATEVASETLVVPKKKAAKKTKTKTI